MIQLKQLILDKIRFEVKNIPKILCSLFVACEMFFGGA